MTHVMTHRDRYIMLRTEKWQMRRSGREAQLRSNLNRHAAELEELSRQIHHPPRGRSVADIERRIRNLHQFQRNDTRELLAMEVDDSLGDDVLSTDRVGQEFDAILLLPGVMNIIVTDDKVEVSVRTHIQHEGAWYDLGDWELTVYTASHTMGVRQLRRTVLKSWHGGGPVYGSDYLFCFGAQQEAFIRDQIYRGQFLQAFERAVVCLHHVNPEHRYAIPLAFKQVGD